MQVSFPTDVDGFLSQECPSCGQAFKALFGDGGDGTISYCPYCGHNGQNCWFTQTQVDYLHAVAAAAVLGPELEKFGRQLKGMSTGAFKISVKSPPPSVPPAPMESDDPYDMVRFPCCNETVKITRQAKHFCVICGTEIDMAASDSRKVFLSHKGVDKALVIDFKESLKMLGYDPWLDDDAMPAGTHLERALLQGMQDSCGVVFFITPSFKDEGFLETEVNYAVQEKRKKGDKFAIVALQFADPSADLREIPDLLKGYVWKKPNSHLEALREIVRALPVVPGAVAWRGGIVGVVTSPVAKTTTTELSDEAKAILKAAAASNGRIHHNRYLGGEERIDSGGVTLIPDASPRTISRWVGGLEDLQRRRYIKDLGHKGEVFEVTREGYDAADRLTPS